MKRIIFLMILAFAMIVSGCNTGTSIINLNPEETHVFTVESENGNFGPPYRYIGEWRLIDTTVDVVVGSTAGSDISSALHSETTTSTNGGAPFTYSISYTPTQESAGEYKVSYDERLSIVYFNSETILSTKKWTWDVVVNGIQVRPFTTITVAPGASEKYTATAYPKGSYNYQWFLDGQMVSTSKTFTFAPSASQVGSHTLTVTAAKSGVSYNFSREISVPVVKLGGSGNDVATNIKKASDGGYFVAGYSNSQDIPGTTPVYGTDAYVAKLNSQGQLLWQRLYDFFDDGGDGDYLVSLEPTKDGGCVLVSARDLSLHNGGYVVKLNSAGDVEWNKFIPSVEIGAVDESSLSGTDYSMSVYVNAVQPTDDGGYIVTGRTLNFDDYNRFDAFAIKLNAAGETLWKHQYGGVSNDTGAALCRKPDGGFIITGTTPSATPSDPARLYDGYILSINAAGETEWQTSVNPTTENMYLSTLTPSTAGGYLAAGNWFDEITQRPVLGNNITLVKFDDGGNIIWDKMFTGSNGFGYRGDSIFQTDGGDYWVVGRVHNDKQPDLASDGYLMRLDKNGAILGQRMMHNYETTSTFYSKTSLVGVAPAANGRYYVAGNIDIYDVNDVMGHTEIFVIALDANGK